MIYCKRKLTYCIYFVVTVLFDFVHQGSTTRMSSSVLNPTTMCTHQKTTPTAGADLRWSPENARGAVDIVLPREPPIPNSPPIGAEPGHSHCAVLWSTTVSAVSLHRSAKRLPLSLRLPTAKPLREGAGRKTRGTRCREQSDNMKNSRARPK